MSTSDTTKREGEMMKHTPGPRVQVSEAEEREGGDMREKCAVEGCANGGRVQICPYDGRLHGHGRIHYNCGHPVHLLKFRANGWFLMCDEHYAVCKADREAWEKEQRQ